MQMRNAALNRAGQHLPLPAAPVVGKPRSGSEASSSTSTARVSAAKAVAPGAAQQEHQQHRQQHMAVITGHRVMDGATQHHAIVACMH